MFGFSELVLLQRTNTCRHFPLVDFKTTKNTTHTHIHKSKTQEQKHPTKNKKTPKTLRTPQKHPIASLNSHFFCFFCLLHRPFRKDPLETNCFRMPCLSRLLPANPIKHSFVQLWRFRSQGKTISTNIKRLDKHN